ncbi:oxygenase [Lithospermum erythrorhizon]|uniref:Oxygenase n=1 Tax=Lithospermum erythrorhizon TaxID=34254 RepID=A0AAV3NUI2_LITER
MIHLSTPVMLFSYIIDELWLISLVLVILLALVASLRVLNKPKSGGITPPKFPPSPPSLPIIGNYHQLGKLPHQSLHKLSQKYGQVMLLNLGSIPTIVISSPGLTKQILKTHDLDFCSRPESQGPRKMTYNLLAVAFAPYNDEWKERRKILSFQILNSKRSNSLLKSKRVEVVKKLIESLSLQASEKNTINLDRKMFHVLGEITTCVAFGKCYTEYQFKGGSQELKGILGEMSNNLLSFSAEDYLPSILGRIIDTISGQRRKLHNCYAKIDAYFETTLREHLHKHERTKGEVDEDYVDVLIRLSKEPKFPFSEQHIKAMFMDIFLGGIDTRANTIVWAMTELIRYPNVMQKSSK